MELMLWKKQRVAILEYRNSKKKKEFLIWPLFFDKESENMRWGWDPQSLLGGELFPERKRNQRPFRVSCPHSLGLVVKS